MNAFSFGGHVGIPDATGGLALFGFCLVLALAISAVLATWRSLR
jgi:hypothetical protein